MREAFPPPREVGSVESLALVQFDMLVAVASARQAASPTLRALQRPVTPRTLAEASAARRKRLATGNRIDGTEVAGSFLSTEDRRADAGEDRHADRGENCRSDTDKTQESIALSVDSGDERQINHSASIDIETDEGRRVARAAGRDNRGQTMDER